MKAAIPRRALTQPVTFSLASFLSSPQHVSFPSEREKERDKRVTSSRASLPPCLLSACRHAHTDDQQTPPAQSGPRAASFPSSRHNLPTVICSHASLIPLLAILGLFLLSCTYSIFSIQLLLPRSILTYGALANGIGNIIPAGLCYYVSMLSLLFLFLPGNQS